jgi:predicted metal-dependent HD superfamily phosphohydrolase
MKPFEQVDQYGYNVATMMLLDFENARDYAIQRLREGLPPQLSYHSLWHTCEDVAVAVERLADMENISQQDRLLLLTGAYFHDIGFTEQFNDHETASIRIATTVLPQFGYSPAEIGVVQRLIEVTRIPQRPHTLLEQIIADADLDVLGRADFWQRSRALYDEITALNGSLSEAEWCETQLRFFEAHQYFTRSARLLRQEGKQRHMAQMRQRLQDGCPCTG